MPFLAPLIVIAFAFFEPIKDFLFPSKEEVKQRKADREKRISDRENEMRRAKELKDRLAAREKELYWERYKQLRQAIEAMPIYENWKKEAIVKSGGKCEMCGETTGLEVHHRISFHKIVTYYKITNIVQAFQCHALWNVDNGSVLCKNCHDKMESSKVYQKINQT